MKRLEVSWMSILRLESKKDIDYIKRRISGKERTAYVAMVKNTRRARGIVKHAEEEVGSFWIETVGE
jgi:hypothetical protein